MIDLLVVGGGPAGLATALYARRAGLDVRVVEQRAGVIDKACGEGLMPGAVAALAELGVHPRGEPIRGIRYVQGARCVDAPFSGQDGRGVRRTALHDALRTAAAEAGIEVRQGKVDTVEQDADGVTAAGLRARYLAAADGLHSPIRRGLGLQLPDRGPPRWGQRRHFALAPWTDHVEVHWSPGAEAYVTPVGPDCVGVAVLSAVRRPYQEHLAAFPALASRLGDGGPIRGAGPLRQRTRCRSAGRVLLVGDAAGYVDALTGEGIAVALGQAAALVACVQRGRPQDYEAAWIGVTRRYRWLTSALLWGASRPLIRSRLVPTAVAVPSLFRAAVGQLAR